MNGVIYARYSNGPKQTHMSIEGQLRDCRAYADRKGITIIDTYIDEHISGKEFENRESLQRMLRDAKKKIFDCVIVWKIDRLGRCREELAFTKAKLKRCGVQLHYAMEHIPEGPEGIILESLMEGLAEYYSAELAQKIGRGMRDCVLSGKMINANPCFGYLVKDRHYVPDPDKRDLLVEIFERYAGGETASKICKDFARRGVKTAAGVDLAPKTVYKILRNEKYTGLYRYGEISIPGFHERLISDELFEEVQKMLQKNAKHKSKRERKENVDYMLTGKLYCGKCKSTMRGESGTGRHGEVHHYYKCSGRRDKKTDCDLKPIRKDDLEAAVIKITQQDVLTDEMIDMLTARIMEIQDSGAKDPALRAMETNIREAEKGIKNIMNAIEMGIITPTTKGRLMELEAERDRLGIEIAKVKAKKTSYTPDEVRFYLESFRDGDAENHDFCVELVNVFVKRIYVYDDCFVMIYNFMDPDGDDEGQCHDWGEIADRAVNEQKNKGETDSFNVSPSGRDATLNESTTPMFVSLFAFAVVIMRLKACYV